MPLVGTTVFAPAYRKLAVAATELETATTACDLKRSKAALRASRLAYQTAYAAHSFSPMELRRLMISVDFWPNDPPRIEALLAGPDPVTVEAVSTLGARLRGLPGVEVVLYGAGPFPGRRCQLATSQSTLIRQAAVTVADGWAALAPTLEGSSTVVGAFVSSLVAAVGLVEGLQLGLPAGLRRGIPANTMNVRGRQALEDAATTLAGVQTAIEVGLLPLVSDDLATRLRAAGTAGQAAVADLPGPLEKVIFTLAPGIDAAQEVIKVLEMLLITEVVGSLGLTLSFPADGD